MTNETLRMQMLSGIITEGQYKTKLQENLFYKLIGKILGVEEDEDEIEDLPRKSEYDNLTDEQAKKAYTELAKKANDLGDTHGDFDASAWVSGYSYAMDVLKDKYPHINFSAKNESLNESMIGGIVGIGAINQIPPRAKADYETAFEHFLGGKYGLNEVEIEEAEIPAIDSEIANDPDFQKLVDYFEENPIKAKKVKDKLKTLEEITENQYGVNKSSDGSYFTQDGVYSTYYFKKNDKYYKKQSLPGGYGFGKHKTDEISKEDFQKIQKEYWKDQLMKIGLGAAAVGFVGALMAGPLGANDPGNILQAALIAAGFGGAAASIFE